MPAAIPSSPRRRTEPVTFFGGRFRVPDVSQRWVPPVLIAAVLLVASVVPPGPVGGTAGPLPVDELLHAAGYAALAGTLAGALATRGRSTRRAATLSFCGAVAYGIGIELVQAGVPYRAFSLADAGANTLGALVGAAVVAEYRRRTRR